LNEVTSTVAAYLELLEVPEGEPRREAWTRQYEAAHPDVFAKYYGNWGSRDRRSHAADRVSRIAPIIRERETRARGLVDAVARDFVGLGLLSRSDLPVVLLVGGNTSNGWVTDFRDEATLFLALEFVGDAPFDDMLVVHESVHVAHAQRSTLQWPGPVATSLFAEGLAVALSRQLRPGLPESAYLWFDDEHESWVRECQAQERDIRHHISDNLDSTDEKLLKRFFGAPDDSPVPARCGYWLGDMIATDLLKRGFEPLDLLGWRYEEILAHLRGI
jgi:hypothetical protein